MRSDGMLWGWLLAGSVGVSLAGAQVGSHGAGTAPSEGEAEVEGEGSGGGGSEAEVDEESAELKRMRAEMERLQVEYQFRQERQRFELMEAELRQNELSTLASLRRAELEAELEEMNAEAQRLQAEAQLRSAREQAEREEIMASANRMEAEAQMMQQRVSLLNARLSEMRAEYEAKTAEVTARLEYLQARGSATDRVLTEVSYPKRPLIGDVLYVSDRRISLNGPIYYGTADYVCDRIDFLNNQDPEAPIFIVIDDSPGGSVIEGYRIVRTIAASRAPVHVVVKSFAASMAALITTLAPNSYAYPDAVILHHQMSTSAYGNMTQLAEQLEWSQGMAARLMKPLAEKMGKSPEEVVRLMYANSSDGDWMEFADDAQKLGWVDHVIEEIREDGIVERPKSERMSGFFFMAEQEEVDGEGQRFVRLPRLKPFDAYFMYNPYGYYRH